MVFAFIGSFIAVLLFMPLVNSFSQYGWTKGVAVLSVLCVTLFLLCFLFTKERVKPIREKQPPLKVDLHDLIKNNPWWILLGAGVAAQIFNSIRDGAAVYYFKYYIIEEAVGTVDILNIPFVLSGLYLAVGQAANIIGVILAAPCGNKIGKKNTFMYATCIAMIFSIAFYWLDKDNLAGIFILQVLISICAGSIFPLLWSMYADCTDYSEYKTGNRATGLLFSASSMSQKLGWALGTAMTGWLLGYFGFQANAIQNEETIQGIKMFLSIFPAVATIVSVLFIHFYPLTETRMTEITHQLNQKRNSPNNNLS
jgi:GPH family glycoside/pentoside/hexuronide:cation symporter